MENKETAMSAEDLHKSFMKDEELVPSLSQFVSQANDFNSKISDHDIVKEYLRVSRNCKEILQLVKQIPSSNSRTVVLIMKTVCHILTRVASDLHIFAPVGTSIANEILSSGMKSVFNFLAIKTKVSAAKIALHLLSSMIALGGQIALQVVAKLNFSNEIFTHLLYIINFNEGEDIRTTFIHFIILIMTSCEFSVLQQLVEVRGFLNDVLLGLLSDRAHIIVLVLSTFRKLIVENPKFMKTTKIKLFNDQSLKTVVKLYSWKGPVKKKASKKRKLGEEQQTVIYEASEEEIESVKSNVHQFMLALFCPFKYGIIFYDPSFGSSGKNLNFVVTNVLSDMPKLYTDKLVCEFMISVLRSCPDQMVHFLPRLKSSCRPRYSLLWLDAMNLIKKIINAQDAVSCLFKHEVKKPVSALINIAKAFCFPNVITPSDICDAFKAGQPFICYHLCDFLVCVLKKVKSIIEFKADSTIPYSTTEISAFNQSFLITILQNFTFMKELEDFWVKLTLQKAEDSEEKLDPDIPLPSLSCQLLKVLELFQHFIFFSSHACHGCEVNIPKLFQSLKNCHVLLSPEEVCNLNVKMVDIISTQGEDAIMLWNKNLIDSPLMVLLDVYLNSPSVKMVEEISKILYKVIVHTKVFEHCPWEIDVWLDSMKSSKAKHIRFIIEFINTSMCVFLQNPTMFSENAIQSTLGKSSSDMDLDATAIINDLLSAEDDPTFNDFEEPCSAPLISRPSFSSLLPAALFTLKSVDNHKKKACELFVEKVLYQIMHHQQSSEDMCCLMQKYKENIDCDLHGYFKLLCSDKYGEKVSIKEENITVKCKTDLSDHLRMKFITLHTLKNSPKGCHCEILCEPQGLGYKYKEKVVWQLLTYLEWEITLFLQNKIQTTDILNYINMLESLLNSLDQTNVPTKSTDEVMEICESEQVADKNAKLKILEEILSRPVMLKLFIWAENISNSKKSLMKDFISSATRLTLKLVGEVLSYEDACECLTQFKDKVVKFNSFYFQTLNLSQNLVMDENSDILKIIGNFKTLFSAGDITHMLEDLLSLVTGDVKLENHFSVLLLLLKMYIELDGFMLLSPNAVNLLFVRYAESSKKKKTLREYIVQMFEKHPILASAINSDTSSLLLQQLANRNFYILGCLIDCNDNMRQMIQTSITDLITSENIEELKSTPDFIYIVSKCILNSVLNNETDTNFLETVSPLFWETCTSYLLTDIASDDTLLLKAGAGKALQILFHREILSVKKRKKFFKGLIADTLIKEVPSPSKMTIFLQIMEVWKNYILKSNKSPVELLKMIFHWLSCSLPSFESSLIPLVHFSFKLLQNLSEVNVNDIVETSSFFPKVLKVALKHREVGSQLIAILATMCQKSQNFNFPTQSLFNLVTGHSNFFNTMLSQIKENEALKESVVDLLITLVSLDNRVCKDNHVALILSSYTGSLKSVDRKLLYLFKLYSENGVDISKFSPFLWSKTASVHYSVMNSGSMHLFKKPKIQDLLNIFQLNMIVATSENYPLTLKLNPTIEDSNEEFGSDVLHKIYDLRFFLPLFASALSPGSFVHLKTFIESRVLMLFFSSLSSFDSSTRAAGYYCLSQLYFHLEGAKYFEKEIWLCLLDSLRNSITHENTRIPNILSLFLARVSLVFTRPDHPSYTILYKFIMVKPNLDIGHVPEFYVLFNSIDIQHRDHRMWLLKLLVDGLRSSLDFHICEKRYIFSLLQTHYWSAVSTVEEKVAILDVISSACKVEVCAKILCQNSILGWLHNVIEEIGSTDTAAEIVKSVCNILKNLWTKIIKVTNKDKKEFEIVVKKFVTLDTSLLNTYLFTLHDVLTVDHTPHDLSLGYISQILECWQEMSDKENHKVDQERNEKEINNTSDFEQSFALCSKIILLWSPDWKSSNEQCYKYQQLLFVKSIQLMLKFPNMSSSPDLPVWIYKCFKSDNRHEVVKLLLSSEGECLRLILEHYEKSLKVQSQFSRTKDDVELCDDPKTNTSNQWRKILLHFKKVCKSCNLIPELNLYHQITMIL